MGVVGRVALVLILGSAAACSRSERGVQGERVPASALATKAGSKSAPHESIYDAQGNLKASATTIGWLQIPQGLTERKGRGTQHVFSGRVPLKALTRFMDARVFTADIHVTPTSVRYGSAGPKTQDEQAMRFDISMYANASGSHVDVIIDERPRLLGKPMSVDELRSVLQQKQARAE